MPSLAFHTPNVTAQIPGGVISIEHATGNVPTRTAIEAALPRKPDNTFEKKYTVIWFGGDHGDVNGEGKPIQFNGCSRVAEFQQFLKDLRDLDITGDAIIADFCFSAAFLPEFYRLLSDDGKFAGWSGICSTQRHEQILTKTLPAIVEETEDNLLAFFPDAKGSSQVVYLKRTRALIRYDATVVSASMKIIDGSSDKEVKEAASAVKRLGKKRALSTRTKTRRALKVFFGVYYLTPDIVADMAGNLYTSRNQFISRMQAI